MNKKSVFLTTLATSLIAVQSWCADPEPEMNKKQNVLPDLQPLITHWHGENYWFNGCAKHVMERLGEKDYDYWFFAGLTGDNFTQFYAFNGGFLGESLTDCKMSEKNHAFVEDIFAKCGYKAEFVPETELRANREKYLRKTKEWIDKGVPVIRYWCGWHLVVGYEDDGETLLCMTSGDKDPYRVSADELFTGGEKHKDIFHRFGWFFVGEKTGSKELKNIYRDAIKNLPKVLATETETYCFGAAAFRAWADEIEGGRFDGMTPDDLGKYDMWPLYAVYVCNLATNGSCCFNFLDKAMELNPDMTFIPELKKLYKRMGDMWTHGADSLEAIGGGFNVSLAALQDTERRGRIAAKIREFGEVADGVLKILRFAQNDKG
ncbi:MAG: hypothetical protein FWF96_06330 [Kiritimatiellaeota bacterium]|nr:hypothetical protein [Kiritimatiellota bacterium]